MSPEVVFIGGISSVFLGMGLLYLSIKATAIITDQITKRKKGKRT